MKKPTLILLLFALAGCNPAAKLAITQATTPTMNGLVSVHGRATVENGGARDLVVENARLTVRYRGRPLGSARLMLPVAMPAGATTNVRYDLALEGVTLASLQTLQSRLAVNPGAFTVDLAARVEWGAWRKKIELNGLEATRIIGIIATFTP